MFFLFVIVLLFIISSSSALPNIQIGASGDMLVDTDGKELKATTSGGQERLVLGPRVFGGRVLLARNDNAYPQLTHRFGHDNLALKSVTTDASIASPSPLASASGSGFNCGYRITFEPLADVPVCTVTQTATGTRGTSKRFFETFIAGISKTQLDIVVLHRQWVAGSNSWLLECEHGDSLMIHCVE